MTTFPEHSSTPLRRVVARLLAVFGMLLAVGGSSAIAPTVAIGVKEVADTIEIEASAVLDADVAVAWRVLTDYERYAEFIPGLRVSRVIARNGSTVTVRQSGDATFWLLRSPVDVVCEIRKSAPTHLVSRAMEGGVRNLESSYVLTALPSGVRLDYTGRAARSIDFAGVVERLAAKATVTRQFRALAEEIEAKSAVATARSWIDTGAAR